MTFKNFPECIHIKYMKQAENGLQSRSSENGSVALWTKITVMDYNGLSGTNIEGGGVTTGMDD